jgi:ubiquinol-cytochrome c reductase cytochrome b subunit
VAFLAMHIALFRRHGLHARDPNRGPAQMFWPEQVLKDSVAALAVMAGVLAVTIYRGGAELGAPADPANPYDAARPEGYFLFLFQFLKWFPGELELWGAIIIPGLVTAVLFLMPWIGRTRAGHVVNVAIMFMLLGGALVLTAQAFRDDYYAAWYDRGENLTPEEAARFEASERFLEAKKQAAEDAERVIELARSSEKIPPTGALALMYDDPYLQGPRLFNHHCSGCHNFEGAASQGGPSPIVNAKPTAPNLWGVGTRDWAASWLDPKQIVGEHRLGYEGSQFVDMTDFVEGAAGENVDDEQRRAAQDAFAKVAAALAAESDLPSAEPVADAILNDGRTLMTGGLTDLVANGLSCVDCHKFHDDGELGSAPDLTGYMSREWVIEFIRNPAAERFYGDNNDRMPAFAAHEDAQLNQLDEKSIGLVVDWLRGDWRRADVGEGDESAK